MQLFARMGATVNKEDLDPDAGAYSYGALFAQGTGQAHIGFTENMSAMGDFANDVDVRLFSMTDDRDVPLFYADLVGVNAKLDESKRDVAFDLAGLLTDSGVLATALAGTESDPTPQYLLVSRLSTYDTLAETSPAYARLKELVETPSAELMDLLPDGRSYIDTYKPIVSDLVTSS